MALPRTLKDFNVFNDGNSYLGLCTELSLPKLTRKMDEFTAAGVGPVKIDIGADMMEIEHTYGGVMPDILAQYGAIKIDAVMLRFAGAYQRDDTGDVDAVEIVVRGRHEEIDQGSTKKGSVSEHKVKSALTYYKQSINGKTLIEIDMLNKIFIVNGVDIYAAQRKAMGM